MAQIDNQVKMTAVQESSPLLSSEEKLLYVGESEPKESGKVPLPSTESTNVSVRTLETVPWSTGVFDCCAMASPEWISSDWEICFLGWQAPCVLYGSNRERLTGNHVSFSEHCLLYLALLVAGECVVRGNVVAPLMTYTSRTEIRRKYNLKGNYQGWKEATSCCMTHSENTQENMEVACDCLLHYFCHPCALCQEARELRRRTPNFSQFGNSTFSGVQISAPAGQTMA